MNKLFGTDGIRGKANQDPITPEMAVKIGKAAAVFFQKKGSKVRILIANDSRISASMLESGLAAGMSSMGTDAVLCGVLPTPGIAWLTAAEKAAAGISVTASHNPYEDNGIKFFTSEGFKLSQDQEVQIERIVFDDVDDGATRLPAATKPGRVYSLSDSSGCYKRFLAAIFSPGTDLKGFKIIVDCANGAASAIAPQLFADLGAEVTALFNHPNGTNINKQCGSEHPPRLKQCVMESRADVGIAFDGDGDRLLVVDESGAILHGEEVLAIFADYMRRNRTLKNNTVVSTVMSNIGLGIALREMGIEHIMTDVGDRHVMEKMKTAGAVLGGENSGHMIFLTDHTTGDGMLSALKLMQIMQSTGQPVSKLKKIVTLYPQTLLNVAVKQKPELDSIPSIRKAIQAVREKLGEKGRVLVRYSGTQPLCRVMVEASSQVETDRCCRDILECIKEALG